MVFRIIIIHSLAHTLLNIKWKSFIFSILFFSFSYDHKSFDLYNESKLIIYFFNAKININSIFSKRSNDLSFDFNDLILIKIKNKKTYHILEFKYLMLQKILYLKIKILFRKQRRFFLMRNGYSTGFKRKFQMKDRI